MATSRLWRMFTLRCPNCGEGRLFPTGTFSFKRSFEMHQRCPNCDASYFPEPGFYFGAMFVSYILYGFFSLGFLAVFNWILGWSLEAAFLLLVLVSAVLFVYVFRVSRSIWLGLLMKKRN
jgi:uncharacterized protein (DUF983 family)